MFTAKQPEILPYALPQPCWQLGHQSRELTSARHKLFLEITVLISLFFFLLYLNGRVSKHIFMDLINACDRLLMQGGRNDN